LSSHASLTDLTLTYASSAERPEIDDRLKGGKSFVDGVQKPLDTCAP
jgi:hypothetical protein